MLENPHLHRLFEVFRLDKSETRIAVIREAVAAARAARPSTRPCSTTWRPSFSIPSSGSGPSSSCTRHTFSRDDELAGCLARLAGERGDPLASLLPALESALLEACARLLPPSSRSPGGRPALAGRARRPTRLLQPAEQEVLRDA